MRRNVRDEGVAGSNPATPTNLAVFRLAIPTVSPIDIRKDRPHNLAKVRIPSPAPMLSRIKSRLFDLCGAVAVPIRALPEAYRKQTADRSVAPRGMPGG
jgi:hypothetical protein